MPRLGDLFTDHYIVICCCDVYIYVLPLHTLPTHRTPANIPTLFTVPTHIHRASRCAVTVYRCDHALRCLFTLTFCPRLHVARLPLLPFIRFGGDLPVRCSFVRSLPIPSPVTVVVDLHVLRFVHVYLTPFALLSYLLTRCYGTLPLYVPHCVAVRPTCCYVTILIRFGLRVDYVVRSATPLMRLHYLFSGCSCSDYTFPLLQFTFVTITDLVTLPDTLLR